MFHKAPPPSWKGRSLPPPSWHYELLFRKKEEKPGISDIIEGEKIAEKSDSEAALADGSSSSGGELPPASESSEQKSE